MTLNAGFTDGLQSKLQQLRDDRVYKRLNHLASPQAARVLEISGLDTIVTIEVTDYP